MSLKSRIARNVVMDGECWLWAGYVRSDGYVVLAVRENGRQAGVYAHRASYEAHVGPIPDGSHLDHLCRRRHCMNPAHLQPVTSRTNTWRGVGPTSVNGHKTHCIHGHPFDEANTHHRPGGGRTCRTCERAKVRRYRAAQKESA